MLPRSSTAPNIIRRWIPLEFSKDVANYDTTMKKTTRREESAAKMKNSGHLFQNKKLFQELQQKDGRQDFKLVFKNKSSRLFQAKKKINSDRLLKKISEGKADMKNLQRMQHETYNEIYESDLNKHFIYQCLAEEEPKSSFNLNRRRPLTISCDLKFPQDENQYENEKRLSCSTAIPTHRKNRTSTTRQGSNNDQRRVTWLIQGNHQHIRQFCSQRKGIKNEKKLNLVINGSRASESETMQHWKLNKQDLIQIMKRIKIM